MFDCKTVLVFGDSLTWGFDPVNHGRHDFEDRWPTVLSEGLNKKANVISEGLNGRSTAYDGYLPSAERNGARILPTLLSSHKPIDLVIIMLGTNDLRLSGAGDANAACHGMAHLIHLVRHHDWSFAGKVPQILIVAPPHFDLTENDETKLIVQQKLTESKKISRLYSSLAADQKCGFFDASTVARPKSYDGIHMDAANTRAIGTALVPIALRLIG